MIYAVDFDGTVVDHCFPKVGEDVPYAVEVLKKMVARGDNIILWTMRSNAYPNVPDMPEATGLQDAINWYKENDIPLYGINQNPDQDKWTISPKAYANQYIDDAAMFTPLINVTGFNRPCVDWTKVALNLNIDLD
jgi:hypothetical protein